MMEIIKATRYGTDRIVIRVCHNHSDPLFIHVDGSAHPAEMSDGCLPPDMGVAFCVYNHKETEVIFDGADQYDGGSLKSADLLWEEVCQRCAVPGPARPLADLMGRSG